MNFPKSLLIIVFLTMVVSILVYSAKGCSFCSVRNGTEVLPRRPSNGFENSEGFDITASLIIASGILVTAFILAKSKRLSLLIKGLLLR